MPAYALEVVIATVGLHDKCQRSWGWEFATLNTTAVPEQQLDCSTDTSATGGRCMFPAYETQF